MYIPSNRIAIDKSLWIMNIVMITERWNETIQRMVSGAGGQGWLIDMIILCNGPNGCTSSS